MLRNKSIHLKMYRARRIKYTHIRNTIRIFACLRELNHLQNYACFKRTMQY